jgi:hypothetical protein
MHLSTIERDSVMEEDVVASSEDVQTTAPHMLGTVLAQLAWSGELYERLPDD